MDVTSAWPMDDLRIRRFPFQTRDEHRARLMYQGYWRTRGSWTPGSSWCLDLPALDAGRVVEAQALEADDFASLGTVGSHSWLIKAVRGRGLGVAMREAATSRTTSEGGAAQRRCDSWPRSGGRHHSATSWCLASSDVCHGSARSSRP